MSHKQRLLAGPLMGASAGAIPCRSLRLHAACRPYVSAPFIHPKLDAVDANAGLPYNAEDPELTDDRIACRKLLHKLNVTLGAEWAHPGGSSWSATAAADFASRCTQAASSLLAVQSS